MEHREDELRLAVQRRAVLAERLLIDLEQATSAEDAAYAVCQALTTVGGADEATVTLRSPDGPHDGPFLQLATSRASNMRGIDEPSTVTDRSTGLDLTVTGAMVPPIAVARTLRALRSALDRLERQEQLLLQARTDGLTGLLNRRAMDERIDVERARVARAGGRLSVLLLDLDGFKVVNDEYGHQAGDRLLTAVAQTLLEIARTSDDAGRIGGDEFALLLPGTDADGARVAAARLCTGIRSLSAPVTASVGIATTREGESRTAAELIRDADEALYAAKNAGRDRAVHHLDLVMELDNSGR